MKRRNFGLCLWASTLWLGGACGDDHDPVWYDSGQDYATVADASRADAEADAGPLDADGQTSQLSGDAAAAEADAGEQAGPEAEADAGAQTDLDAGAEPDADSDAAPLEGADAGTDGGEPDGTVDQPDAGHPESDAQADTGTTPEPLEIDGSWHSGFGGMEEIASSTWKMFDSNAVVEYDNDANYAILQNPDSAAFYPGKFSKVIWTEPSAAGFFYCTVAFGLDSAELARANSVVPDASNPEQSGCSGFAWTRLDAPIEIAGTYRDDMVFEISSDNWADQTLRSYDNATNVAIMQNPSTGSEPLKFSKVVWREPTGTALEVCWVVTGVDTAAEALSSAGDVDPDDLNNGCNGGSFWHYEAP